MGEPLDRKVKTVFVTPLDWGLGHATRCIPVIDALLNSGYKVLLGGSGLSGKLLQEHYPKLEYIALPEYNLHYSNRLPMALSLLAQWPKVRKAMKAEQKILAFLKEQKRFDLLINDNRLGCQVEADSIYLTHQLQIAAPFAFVERLLSQIHQSFYKNYKAIWVPDFPEAPGLAGKLSHPTKVDDRVRYIGPITRFTEQEHNPSQKVLLLLSGLEPHRTNWENSLLEQAKNLPEEQFVLVRGKPNGTDHLEAPDNVTIFSHLPSEKLQTQIATSKLTVCRTGYSTLMDLTKIEVPIALCPTPEQTEQEYLAKELSSHTYVRKQNEFQLSEALESKTKSLQKFVGPEDLLNQAIESLLDD